MDFDAFVICAACANFEKLRIYSSKVDIETKECFQVSRHVSRVLFASKTTERNKASVG